VLGFFRPRIVMPGNFQDYFTLREQAAILAHEHVHLARQDARINALTALLRCFCWFNPLIHLGARWLRFDQELACDARAVAGGISRQDYAKALLKSQIMVTSLPVGCNWPGAQHPLIERIALLKRKPPGATGRLAGVSLVFLAASLAGLGAWAAQPPVSAKTVALSLPRMVARPASSGAPDQTVQEPARDANLAGSGHEMDAPKDGPPDAAVLPARVQAPTASGIQTRLESDLTAQPGLLMVADVQTSTQAATESVTVSGTKMREGFQKFLRGFVAPNERLTKLTRWERRICPLVVGQNSHFATFISQRIKYIALAAGARVNDDASCTPNIEVVFTTTPQALLDDVRQHHVNYLGYAETRTEVEKLAIVTRPIQAWYMTESVGATGRGWVDSNILANTGGNLLFDVPTYMSSGGRIRNGMRSGFYHILITVDSSKLAGQDIVPLADYISLLALTELEAPETCQQLSTIANRMAADCDHGVESLTQIDLAYLQGLYGMSADRKLMFQRNDIAAIMAEKLMPQK
jgi:hypothetical protein